MILEEVITEANLSGGETLFAGERGINLVEVFGYGSRASGSNF